MVEQDPDRRNGLRQRSTDYINRNVGAGFGWLSLGLAAFLLVVFALMFMGSDDLEKAPPAANNKTTEVPKPSR